jgi:hypothetical protein
LSECYNIIRGLPIKKKGGGGGGGGCWFLGAMSKLHFHFNINVFEFVLNIIALCIRLCQECQTLIENHDQIKILSNARNNLNTTLKVGGFNLS